MTRISRRILCLALAILMAAALLPDVFSGNTARAEDTLGKIVKELVNVRSGPSMKDPLYCRVPKNTVCVVKRLLTANGYDWYNVIVKDPESKWNKEYDAYIRADCLTVLTDAEAALYGGSGLPVGDGTVVTAPPSIDSDPAAPDGTVGVINNWGVNFRVLPWRAVIKQLDKGVQVKVLTVPKTISRETWYKVELDGVTGYIMSIYLDVKGVVIPDPTATPTSPGSTTPTPAPATDPDALGYVQTTKGSVNVRASIGGTVITTVARWQTFPYLLAPVKRGNYTWYFIRVSTNVQGYVRSDCVRVVNKPNPNTPTPAPVITADPSNPTPTPVPTEPTGYVKTTMSYVNIRKSPGGDRITVAEKKGTVYPYYGEPTVSGKVKWYKIYDPSFSTRDHFAYIHGNFVAETDKSGGTTPAPATPTPAPGPTADPANPTQPPLNGGVNEADYVTLKTGSSGSGVKALVTELKNQGYYTGEIISKYTSAVENAVRDFQKAKGLAVDGIAGADTQHKLFNTVPIGTADRNNLTMTLYPAEKIDWFTGGIQELWPRGSNFKVYDVQTGIVFWAHRWSGGLHADIEPLTKADTARICKMYGVSKSSDITEKKNWQRRPCLVTIGTRTFACSLFGVPHNYPDGDTISDNDFRGQMCLHFTNSKTHDSKKVDSGHQEAIEYAWLNAPNGHK